MSSMSISFGNGNYLTTGEACTGIHFGDGSQNHFDADMLGDISEWLAAAWENVAGEEYKPVVISENGYVADPGVVTFSKDSVVAIKDAVSIAVELPRTVRVERDCE